MCKNRLYPLCAVLLACCIGICASACSTTNPANGNGGGSAVVDASISDEEKESKESSSEEVSSTGISSEDATLTGTASADASSTELSSEDGMATAEKTSEAVLPDNVILSDLRNAKDIIEGIYRMEEKNVISLPESEDLGFETVPENAEITVYDHVTIGNHLYLLTCVNDFVGISTLEKQDDGNYRLLKVEWGNNLIEQQFVTDEEGSKHILAFGYNIDSRYATIVFLVKDAVKEEHALRNDLPDSKYYILDCAMPDEVSDVYGLEVYSADGKDLTDTFYDYAEKQDNTFSTAISAMH